MNGPCLDPDSIKLNARKYIFFRQLGKLDYGLDIGKYYGIIVIFF